MDWAPEDTSNLYNLAHWGEGFFEVGNDGQLWVRPNGASDPARAGLADIIARLRGQSLGLPCLLRFPQILQQRLQALQQAFAQAMQRENYGAGYTPVYPIKVNQQRRVVEEILHAGAGCLGLEAGSKPELLTVLALMPVGGTVICNGYKDAEYIRLALMGERLGLKVYLVVEKSAELPRILQISREMQVQPRIGVRARLASAGAGKWQNTGGEKSKFGLSSTEILRLVADLAAADALDCLQLLHFHLGSQIPNIQYIHGGMRECARLYAELRRLGADLRVVDVGGGLGVDYEGTHSRAYCSTNYRLEDYAQAVVGGLAEICRQEALPEPQIISESGRALTAHHAVLLFDVIDVEAAAGESLAENDLPKDHSNPWVRLLARVQHSPDARTALEVYQKAVFRLGGQGTGGATVRALDVALSRPAGSGQARPPGDPRRIGRKTPGQIFCQFFAVPILTGCLGHRPGLSHHAHTTADRASGSSCPTGGHYLRLRWPHRCLRHRGRSESHPASTFLAARRAVLPCRISGWRLPGNTR